VANEVKLRVEKREIIGKHTAKLRAQGLTPGNISGGGKPSTSVQIDTQELNTLIKHHGAPILRIQVEPSGGTDIALLAKVERDPVSRAILHVDFRRIVLSHPIKARVPLHTVGDAPAIKLYNGVLLHVMESIEIEALPRNLPDALTIDISGMEELNSTLTAKDIQSPANVQVLVSPDEPVITIKAPRVEVEEPVAAEAAAGEAAEAAEGAAGEATEAESEK
jgi:large subunit ribosomal protein L25